MSVRDSFVKQFGEEAATALETAANGHANPYNAERGDDAFKWVLCICIGYECFEKERYRDYHGIKPRFEDIKRWIIEDGNLDSHNGGFDSISLLAGVYKDFMPVNCREPQGGGE